MNSEQKIESGLISQRNMSPVKDKKEPKVDLEKQRKRDREMVTGIFRFLEIPGGTVRFPFREYRGDPIERFSFEDGKMYRIPRGVARHLNNRGCYHIHAYQKDEAGTPTLQIGKKVHRFTFSSTEFLDIDSYNDISRAPELITVERIK